MVEVIIGKSLMVVAMFLAYTAGEARAMSVIKEVVRQRRDEKENKEIAKFAMKVAEEDRKMGKYYQCLKLLRR